MVDRLPWVVSMAAIRFPSPVSYNFRHAAATVLAASQDEAVGMGLRIARKLWPDADGYRNHHAVADAAGRFVNPDEDLSAVNSD